MTVQQTQLEPTACDADQFRVMVVDEVTRCR